MDDDPERVRAELAYLRAEGKSNRKRKGRGQSLKFRSASQSAALRGEATRRWKDLQQLERPAE